ncbi:unnamed protein product [Blepharisma stoltei]|uniref:CSC1/OSCA1-like cytosolic domain-containing protein n=1 Tax=Blepharisma stoltei TaxID=1481888 RepID=A0AAU9K4N9_9CILI|nr:unnamed protein product [Blepharisma stoltei]
MEVIDGLVNQIGNAVGIQPGGIAVQGGIGLENEENKQDLADSVQFADLDKAKAFRDRNTVRDWTDDGRFVEYSVWSTSPQVLGEYGVGLELYFTMLKYFAFLFLIISLISIWPILENWYGSGLDAADSEKSYSTITLANNGAFHYKSIPVTEDANAVLDDEQSDVDDFENNQIRVAVADFLYTFVFIGFLVYYKKLSKKVAEKNFKDNVTAGDYAVEIKGLPAEDIEEKEIIEHFQKFGEVVEVYLARKYNGWLGSYKTRAKLSFQEGYLKLMAQNDPTQEAKLKAIQEDIREFDEKLLRKRKDAAEANEDLIVDRAYLVFNDVSSRKKCLTAYDTKLKLFRKQMQPKELRFRGTYSLVVKPTVEPSNIKWENLEYGHWNRQIRRTIIVALSIGIMIGSIILMCVIQREENLLPSSETCAKKINKDASLEYAEANYTSDTKTYCWCMQQSFSKIVDNSDYNHYCKDYISQLSIATTVRVFASIGIIAINYVLKWALAWLTRYERASTWTKEQLAIMNKLFFVLFFNTSMINLFVNANFEDLVFVKDLAFKDYLFNGDYDDFSRDWYTKVGATIVVTMFIGIASPHFITLFVMYPINVIKRRFFYKYYKMQHELNALFAGPEFQLSVRVAQIMNTIFTCFLYSGGMPLLNIICFFTLFFAYWTDKFLILRYYRTPPLYSNHLNDRFQIYMPYAVLLHCGFSLYMYGADEIFPKSLYVNDSRQIMPEHETLRERISRDSGVLNMTLISLIFVIFISVIILNEVLKFRKTTAQVGDEQTRDDQGTYKANYKEIKEHGIPSYDIMQNPIYKPVLVSLNDAAHDIAEAKGVKNTKDDV